MIVDENKTFFTLERIGTGCVFKHSDTYFMKINDSEPRDNDRYTMCVDIESGYVCDILNSTLVEPVICKCVVKGGD